MQAMITGIKDDADIEITVEGGEGIRDFLFKYRYVFRYQYRYYEDDKWGITLMKVLMRRDDGIGMFGIMWEKDRRGGRRKSEIPELKEAEKAAVVCGAEALKNIRQNSLFAVSMYHEAANNVVDLREKELRFTIAACTRKSYNEDYLTEVAVAGERYMQAIKEKVKHWRMHKYIEQLAEKA